MNYVKSLKMLNVEARQLPCITGSGAPTMETVGAVGELYMDSNTHKVYKCIATSGGAYIWEVSNVQELGSSEVTNGIPIEISSDDSIYITDIAVNTEEDPDITFSGKNLLDNSLFLDSTKWRHLKGFDYDYVFDIPAGTYTFSVKKKPENLCKQYVYFEISNDDFATTSQPKIIVIYQKTWQTSTFTFTLQEGEKARLWRNCNTTQNDYQSISDVFDNAMLEEGTVNELTYIPYSRFSLPYSDTKNLRIPAFDKYVKITNSENADMEVSYTLGGSLCKYIVKTPMDAREAHAWIGDGDGKTDYTQQIQDKIDELVALNNGGTIYLGNGTYNISDSLTLYSNIKVVGTGKTIINQTSDNTHAVVWNGEYISMQDLTIALSGECTELTGCIYANSEDTGKQITNCTIRNVRLLGTYEAKKQEDGTLSMQDYRGCGLYADCRYFLYSDFSNVKVRRLYAGIYGGSGGNRYGIYETYCRYAVYGGGRNNMFDISGHSGYYNADDGTIVGTTEYDCYVTGHNNTFKLRAFDSQHNTSGYSVYFTPLSHNNTYDVGTPAGAAWGGATGNVIDHGSINKCLGDFKLLPFAMGQRLMNIQGECEFRYADGATANAIAGAGIWGEIASNVGWDGFGLSLNDICRYPKDSFYNSFNGAYVRSQVTPTTDAPIEISISLKDRPIISNGGIWIQFDNRYVAKEFTVDFYDSEEKLIDGYTHNVSDNHRTLWTSVPVPKGNTEIYKIIITFTEALQIPGLKWEGVSNDVKTGDYNLDGLIGIVNIGAVSNELYGRAFLGECGGSLYGNVDMHNKTFKNLPTPLEDGDAVPKSYIDAQVGDIETVLDSIIAIQNSLIGGDSE